jgi:hypothetical protein
VEFPLSEGYRTIGPVRLVDGGLVLWEDSGTSERMDPNGLTYTASDKGIHRVRLFVTIFDWAGERHVRRSYWGTNVPMNREILIPRMANKVALTVSKDERSMYRRLNPWIRSAS